MDLKKNLFNTAVLIIAVVLVLMIALKFFAMEERTLDFTGTNVYRAVYVHQVMSHRGYLVNAEIEGKWIDTGKQFNEAGLILESGGGRFLILSNNRELTVGGSASASEDIAAMRIKLKPLHKAVIKVGIEPLSYASLDEFILKMNDVAVSIAGRENIYDIGIVAKLMVDIDNSTKPTIIQEIDNILRPNNEIRIYDGGLYIGLNNANLKDIATLNSLLNEKNLVVSKVATSRIILLVRSNEMPSKSSSQLISGLNALSVEPYFLTIINKPVQ